MVSMRTVGATLVVLLTTVSGCAAEGSGAERAQSRKPVADSPTTSGESRPADDGGSTAPTQASTPKGSTPTVVVLDEGKAPRRILELDVAEGHTESSTWTTDQSQRVQGKTVDTPPISFDVRSQVESADDDEIVVTQTFEGVRVDDRGFDPGLVRQIEAGVEPLVGVTTTLRSTRTGVPLGAELDIPPETPAAMRSIMRQFADQVGAMSVPYPDQGLGIGARWQATTRLELNGVVSEQVTTYRLESLRGTSFRVSSEVLQRFVPGPADAGVDVISGEGAMHGLIRGSTKALLPLRSSVRGTTDVVLEAEGRRLRTATEQRIDVTTTLP